MNTSVPCRICGQLPYVSSHCVCLGHGDYLRECVVCCMDCHVSAFSDDRARPDDFVDVALLRWERLMRK